MVATENRSHPTSDNDIIEFVMRVLFINSVCGIRSTGRIVTDLADVYMADGHQCKIAYGRENAPAEYMDIAYRIGTDTSVKINALKTRIFDNDAFCAKGATKRLIEFADNYDPDLLWLHNLHGYYINIELLFEWIKSRPQMEVRWTLHDCWAFTGHCAHFSAIGCEGWRSGCGDCPQKGEYPKSIVFDNSKSNYARKKNAFLGVNNMTLVTPSHWLADLVKQSFLGAYPTEVVHNTIDVDVFVPTKGDFRERHGLGKTFVVLGVASAWSEKKGLSDFVRLSLLLGEGFRVVLVGLTKKQIKTMPHGILCIERTNSKKELAEIYTAADAFVNLTYEDTYPTVNLEATACGTPCITYRTGGSVESVPEENVAEQGDVEAVARMLKGMKADKSQ